VSVSRKHATISYDANESKWIIIDHVSGIGVSSGTGVNKKKIKRNDKVELQYVFVCWFAVLL
jgi:pSer/pThr/pTyr-binding forkhead associated (FHA) protein